MTTYDIQVTAYNIIEALENAYHDRDGKHRGREIDLFTISDIYLVEHFLKELITHIFKEKNAANDNVKT